MGIYSNRTYIATNTLPISKVDLASNKQWWVQCHKVLSVPWIFKRESVAKLMTSLLDMILGIAYVNEHWERSVKLTWMNESAFGIWIANRVPAESVKAAPSGWLRMISFWGRGGKVRGMILIWEPLRLVALSLWHATGANWKSIWTVK